MNIKKLSISFLISVVIFAIYIEITPGMGNIWIRMTSSGYRLPNLNYLFNYMIQPLTKSFLWNFRFLDINSFVFCFLTTLALYNIDTSCFSYSTDALIPFTLPDTPSRLK